MNEKHQCENCNYFFDKQGIHCAVHPYGKESDSCSDYQQKKLSTTEKLININRKTKSLSSTRFANCLLGIGVTFLIGYPFYQTIFPAIHADKNYDIYKKGCEVFLERASNAGTTGVATENLVKGVNWLKSNSSTQRMEYKNLKANLDYLGGQPRNLAMPVTITNSISSNLKNLKEKQLKLRDEGRQGLESLADLLVSLLLLILSCVLLLLVLLNQQDYWN